MIMTVVRLSYENWCSWQQDSWKKLRKLTTFIPLFS